MVLVVFFENLSQIKDIMKDKNLENSFVKVIKKNRISTWQKPRILWGNSHFSTLFFAREAVG